MDLTDKEREVLKEGFLIKGFFEAFMKLVAVQRDMYARRIGIPPKRTQEEHALYLFIGNGGCLALDEFKREIERLHKLALSE